MTFCCDFILDKKSAASQPKKKGSARRHKAPLSNGKVANGGTHLTNGTHSRAALNSEDSQEGEPLLNGHHTGTRNTSFHGSMLCMKGFKVVMEDSALTSLTAGAPCDQIIC